MKPMYCINCRKKLADIDIEIGTVAIKCKCKTLNTVEKKIKLRVPPSTKSN